MSSTPNVPAPVNGPGPAAASLSQKENDQTKTPPVNPEPSLPVKKERICMIWLIFLFAAARKKNLATLQHSSRSKHELSDHRCESSHKIRLEPPRSTV